MTRLEKITRDNDDPGVFNKDIHYLLEVIEKLKISLECIENEGGLTILGPAENECCFDIREAHSIGAAKAFEAQAETAREGLKILEKE